MRNPVQPPIRGGYQKQIYLESHPNDSRLGIEDSETSQTLSSRMGTGGGNTPLMMEENMAGHYVVRRITPREAERLQGFPDDFTEIGDWTDSKGKQRKTTDAGRYKALGNSFAVPVVRWIGQRIDWAMANPITEDTSDKLDYQPDLFGF